jgi:hypothetical protein
MLRHLPKRYETICGKTDFLAETQRVRHERLFEDRIQQIVKQEKRV